MRIGEMLIGGVVGLPGMSARSVVIALFSITAIDLLYVYLIGMTSR
jgi:hypothetical protein